MKTENNINRFLTKNSIAVLGALLTLIGVVVYSIFTNNMLLQQKNNYYIIAQEGKLVSVEQVQKREVIAIEMKHHLSMFVDFYYNLNQNNWERKVNKALWLGDLQRDFENRENKGDYANIIQWGVERLTEINDEDIELIINENTSYFKVIFEVVERYTDKLSGVKTERKFRYFIRGTLRLIEPNFPFNPHGLYIENFREDKKIEIIED